MCRDHVDVDAVLAEPAYVLVGLLLSYVIDDMVALDRPRLLARRTVMWILAHGRMPIDDELDNPDPTFDPAQPPDPETWGLDPADMQAQDRALAMFGG